MTSAHFPTHAAELCLTHNQHKSYYQTAAVFIAEQDRQPAGATWKDDASKQRAIATDEIWELQWYPRTPVGFLKVAAPTLEELLDFANEAANQP